MKIIKLVLLLLVVVVLFSSHIAAQWTQTALKNSIIHALVVSKDTSGNDLIFAGTCWGGGIYLSTDIGATWNPVNTGLPQFESFVIFDLSLVPDSTGKNINLLATGAICFGGSMFFPRMYRSVNNGASWAIVDSGLTSNCANGVAVIHNGSGKTSIYAGTAGIGEYEEGSGVYRSTNFGASWKPVNNSFFKIPQDTSRCYNINDLVTDGSNLFAATNAGVFCSADQGENWTPLNSGLINLDVHSLAFVPNGSGNDYLFAGVPAEKGEGGIYFSSNFGISWNPANSGLTNLDIATVIVCPKNNGGNDLFVATSGGVFLSTDYGMHWSAINSGFTNMWITSLAVTKTHLFAGTYGGGENSGVWQRPLSEMIITNVELTGSAFPKRYELFQNYPNPFNPTTTINYQIVKDGPVTLKIFDLLGREVAMLVNEKKDAGSYSVQWRANGPSGIYFYTLTAGKYSVTKRMVFIK